MFSTVRLAIIGSLALVGVGFFTAYSVTLYNKGWYAHEAQVHEQDRKALENAHEALQRFRDCVANDGMRWNATTGECERGM